MKRISRIAAAMVSAAVAWGCGGGGGGSSADVSDAGGSRDAFDAALGDEAAGAETVPNDPGVIADQGQEDAIGLDGQDLAAPPDELPSHEAVLDPGGDLGADPGSATGFVISVKVDSEVPGEPVPLEGALVTLLDNETGQPLGPEKVTDQNGQVVFDVAAGLVFGVKVAKETYVDRYQFDIHESDGSFQTGLISLALVQGLAQAIGIAWDPAKGMVVGSVGFVAVGGPMEPVGCAVVSSDPAGEVRYWDPVQDMPATPEKAPMTSAKNSNFLVANVDPGPVQLTAKVSDAVIATKTTRVFAAGMTSVEMTATTAENPTPAGCAY